MTVGVGIPESLLYEMISELKITNATVVPLFADLIAKEIAATKHAIDSYKGTGIYQDQCVRWAIHLEAYERVQDILNRLVARNVRKKRNAKV